MSRRRNINVNSVDIKKFTTDSTNITDYTPVLKQKDSRFQK